MPMATIRSAKVPFASRTRHYCDETRSHFLFFSSRKREEEQRARVVVAPRKTFEKAINNREALQIRDFSARVDRENRTRRAF